MSSAYHKAQNSPNQRFCQFYTNTYIVKYFCVLEHPAIYLHGQQVDKRFWCLPHGHTYTLHVNCRFLSLVTWILPLHNTFVLYSWYIYIIFTSHLYLAFLNGIVLARSLCFGLFLCRFLYIALLSYNHLDSEKYFMVKVEKVPKVRWPLAWWVQQYVYRTWSKSMHMHEPNSTSQIQGLIQRALPGVSWAPVGHAQSWSYK
jgi:hypothetical protein